MEGLTLNSKHQTRLEVITRVESGRLSKQEAAQLLGVSRRQVDNILRRFRDEGVKSVIHGNTGRAPAHKTPRETVEAVLQLASQGGPYHDLSVPHLRLFLAREHGIHITRPTLDRILRQAGVRLTRRRKPTVTRKRRQRSSAEGMLVLIDASPHAWLEERGPRLTLIGAIDDATGKVLYLSFHPTENLQGYLRLLRSILVQYGLPAALYHDRHTIFCSPKEPSIDDQLQGRAPKTQFGSVLELLGIQSIAAHSPQAKGRIERLWGTLQDRLVKEMRLAGISTLEEANAFLTDFIRRYNTEFAVAPADPDPIWVTVQDKIDLDYYLSERHTRVVRPDHTISWMGQTIQLLNVQGLPVRPGLQVTVHRTTEDTLLVYHGKTRVPYTILPAVSANVPARTEPKEAKQTPPPRDPEKRRRQCAWLHAGVR